MKTHRNILFISFVITIISLAFVIYLDQTEKGFQIALAFMGSSFISFMLELPNFISLRQENTNKLYYFLSELKTQTMLLKNNTNHHLETFNYINDKYYEKSMEKILYALNNLKTFDLNFYTLKKKNQIVINIFNNITNSYNNLNQAVMKFPIDFNKRKIEILEIEKCDRNISSKELSESLNCISNMCNNLIETIDLQVSILLSKRQMVQWNLDELTIKNVINNFNIDKK
ncbi:MAG: hypothetical protein IJA30_02575 [Bacilli bacterium]|nr:hypothetical protein [Bacilli bacterium]